MPYIFPLEELFMMKHRIFGLMTALVLMCALSVSAAAFSDVPASHWAAEDIARCAEMGYFKGESADRFGLGKPMTRAGFVTALGRFFGWEETSLTAPYTDVSAESWYSGAVNAAYANGAITAQSAAFRPSDPITREEMAVMLIRALGYGPISGLAQEADLPFTDVNTNRGYLTLAYDFGLVSGTSSTTFSPDAAATREQAAIILMRLYDKLQSPVKAELGIVTDWGETSSLAGFDVIAARAQTLSASGKKAVLSGTMVKKDLAAVRDAAGRRPVLLGVSAKESVLKLSPTAIAQVLADAVEEGYYDGLYLNIPAVTAPNKDALTALVQAVDAALGERRFYLAVEAPALTGTSYEGYDYPALSQSADTLVVRPAQIVEKAAGFTAAPKQATEECWYALRSLRQLGNVTLLLDGQGTAWRSGKAGATLTGTEISKALESGAEEIWSGRYDCSCYENGGAAVWYLSADAAAQRMQLLNLMGAASYALTGAEDVYTGTLAGLNLN